jgi:hypothetical protein
MSGHTYTVELRIFSRTLDPSAITRELGIAPSAVRLPGSVRSDGRALDAMWVFNGARTGAAPPPEWSSLEEGLTALVDKLWPSREAIAGYRSAARVIWWCGNFQTSFDGGPSLSPSLLKKLGEFGAELFIDNYFSTSAPVNEGVPPGC